MALTSTPRSTGYQSNYTQGTIEITGSSSGTFVIGEGSLILAVTTDERDQHARWSGMKAEFTMMIESSNNAAMETFISDLNSSGSENIFCKISINGNVKLIGRVSAEGSEWADNVNAREFRVSVVDGMGRLEAKNFSDDSGDPYGGIDTIEQAIIYCMSKIGTGSLFGGTPMLLILHSKTADGQTVSGNPMANQGVDYAIWHDKGDDNVNAFKTAREVMEDIMVTYGLCLKYVGPHFLLYEPKLLASGGTAYAYDGSGSYIGTLSGAGGSIAIANNKTLSPADRRGGSGFSALPPYSRSHVKYDHGEQDINMLFGFHYEGYNHYQDPGPDGSMHEVGFISVGASEIINLRFSGKLRTKSDFYGGDPPPRWKNHRYHFRIKLRFTDESSGDFWLKREFLPFDFYSTIFSSLQQMYWDSSGYFNIITDIIDEQNRDVNLFTLVGFDTPALTIGENCKIYFGFEVVNVFDENLNIVDLSDNPVKCWWEFSDLSLVAVQDGNIVKRPTYTDYTVEGDPNNSDFYTATTHIGDGPSKTSVGRLLYNDGEWKDTTTWDGAKIIEKVVAEILGNREESVGILTGGIYSLDYWFDLALTYLGKTYLPMSVSYNVGRDEWSGEWVEFKVGGGLGTVKIALVKSDEQVELPKNPNRLPDDENLEWRKREILTGTDGYKKGTTGITSVLLKVPAEYDYWKKHDLVDIIDPVIGYVDTLTLTDDVDEGDTSISIESWTPSEDFPPGSYLTLNKKYEASRKRYYQRHIDFTGTNWDITVKDLPDPASYTTDEMSLMVLVYKNGVKLMYLVDIDNDDQYHKGFDVDVSGVNRIQFLEACNHAVIETYLELT